jgi:class 3 adenylate cyclase
VLFKDIAGALQLQQMLDDKVAVKVIQEHQELVRGPLNRPDDGEEIETAGDSFLLIFRRESRAVHFALSLPTPMSLWLPT